MTFNLKTIFLASALSLAAPLASFAGDAIDVAGVWTFDQAESETALRDKGASDEEIAMAMMVLSESAVVFDDEEDVITFLGDAETIAGVCAYTENGDGVLTLTECIDGDDNSTDPAIYGVVTLYDDETLSTEDETFIAWYRKAE